MLPKRTNSLFPGSSFYKICNNSVMIFGACEISQFAFFCDKRKKKRIDRGPSMLM